MLFILTLIGFAALVGLAICLAALTGVFYGSDQAKARWIVQQRRDARRQEKQNALMLDKILILRGAGALTTPRGSNNTVVQTGRGKKFVSASQVIAELQDHDVGRTDTTPPSVSRAPSEVPEPIAKEFLKEAATAVSQN